MESDCDDGVMVGSWKCEGTEQTQREKREKRERKERELGFVLLFFSILWTSEDKIVNSSELKRKFLQRCYEGNDGVRV